MSISTFERNGIIDLLSKKEGVFHLPRCPRIIHRGHAWIWFAMYVPVHDFSFFIQMAVVGEDGISGLVEFGLHNLRDYGIGKHRRVDDYPFGGEAGMVMQIEPIDNAIAHLKSQRDYDEVIFTSPDGEKFTQSTANQLSLMKNIIILCGHYKGIDFRIREHLITREISIGDFVLTGGELAAAMIADAVVRVIPDRKSVV